MRDRLIELLSNAPADFDGNRNVCTLAEHLLENGVIIPPCKVGDTVFYFDDYYKRIKELQFTGIEPVIDCKSLEGKRQAFLISALGKTVFLTREAAEQGLKGR